MISQVYSASLAVMKNYFICHLYILINELEETWIYLESDPGYLTRWVSALPLDHWLNTLISHQSIPLSLAVHSQVILKIDDAPMI